MSKPYDNGSDDTYPDDVEDRNDDSARYEAILDDDLPEASKKIEVEYQEDSFGFGGKLFPVKRGNTTFLVWIPF